MSFGGLTPDFGSLGAGHTGVGLRLKYYNDGQRASEISLARGKSSEVGVDLREVSRVMKGMVKMEGLFSFPGTTLDTSQATGCFGLHSSGEALYSTPAVSLSGNVSRVGGSNSALDTPSLFNVGMAMG